MQYQLIARHVEALRERALPDGGFVARVGGSYRPDATAWAILALAAAGLKADVLGPPRTRLAADQFEDGRLSVLPDHPDAFWPTPLAILAWYGSPQHREAQSRALDFLLRTHGRHWQKQPGSPFAHDATIQGWPWIAGTHSWLEPTALSLLALRISGYGEHQRAQEATRLLMDRQLPRGGWNYGNKIVFGHELYPLPETTGVALNALAGRVPRERVESSLAYLRVEVDRLRTPLSLGWGLLGLGAWGEYSGGIQPWIIESLKRQEQYGSYDTTWLSLLLVAFFAKGGLLSVIAQ